MKLTVDDVTIRREARESPVLRVTPAGIVALIPRHLDPADEAVRDLSSAASSSSPRRSLPPRPALPRTSTS
jgi:hypothetical protein